MENQEKTTMARKKLSDEEAATALTAQMTTPVAEEVDVEDMPLVTLTDYMRYNRRAREMNKRLKILRYPCKVPPTELHPHERVVFTRNDQPSNPLPVFLSNDMIHYDRTKLKDQLVSGKTYDLPRVIIQHLAEKGVPLWKWFDNPDGSKETRKAGVTPRFSLRTVYAD